MPLSLAPEFWPLLGETAWHALIEDPRIPAESERHFQEVTQLIRTHDLPSGNNLHILEVGCYAHTTGYRLAQEWGAQVTLFELSPDTLRHGRSLGAPDGTASGNPRLVIGDFHHLPFADHSFTLVFLCSALHHTWNHPQVLRELMRVLAPGGLLFLENEPILRSLCFYRFRCNRLHEFTPLETQLQALGLLTTLAEPYLGSRPETLYGMVENQCMPLATLIELIESECDMESVFLATAACVGPWETQLVQKRLFPAWQIAAEIEETWLTALDSLRPLLTPRELGLGRSLPSETEIHAFAQRAAREIKALPSEENDSYILALAHLFGAPLQLVARKKTTPDSLKITTPSALAQAFNDSHPCHDGIFNGFPAHVQAWLTQPSRLPDLQKTDIATLRTLFPETAWRLAQGEFPLIAMDGLTHTLRSLASAAPESELRLPKSALAVPTLLVMRVYAQLVGDSGFALELVADGCVLAHRNFFQSESFLFRVELPAREDEWRVRVRQTALEPNANAVLTTAVSHLALYALA